MNTRHEHTTQQPHPHDSKRSHCPLLSRLSSKDPNNGVANQPNDTTAIFQRFVVGNTTTAFPGIVPQDELTVKVLGEGGNMLALLEDSGPTGCYRFLPGAPTEL